MFSAACTGKESSEPWTSPSAAQINFPSINAALPELNSPPLSPPSLMQRGPQRSIAKSSALRLITNFGDASNQTRAQIFSNEGDGATPIAAGVTPIAVSAISPGLNDTTTAFLRPSQRSVFNTPSSARPTTGGFGRQRLPSIGEGPQGAQDANHPRNVLKGVSDALGLAAQPSESIDAAAHPAVPQMMQVDNGNNLAIGMALPRASTSSPLYRRKEQPPPSPSPASLAALMDGRHSRNGPRDRIPAGIDLQLAPVAPEAILDMTSPEQTGASSNRYRWPSRRRGPASVSSSVTSNSSIAHGARSHRYRTGDVPNTSKTLDEYISSLEVINAKAARASSKDRHHRSRDVGRQRLPSVATPSASSVSTVTSHSREPSTNTDVREWVQTRSRAGSKTGGNRSPRSPVPMSPEDLISLTSTPRMFARDDPALDKDTGSLAAQKTGSKSSAVPPPVSTQLSLRPSSKSRPSSRTSSRGRSTRNRSPDRQPLTLDIPRGRNSSRTASAIRSPSSPLPFSNNAAQYQDEDDEEDYRRAVDDQEKFRNRDRTSHRGRSSSQGRRDASPSSVRARERSRSRRRPTPEVAAAAAPSVSSRKDRTLTGPPPAKSAMAVAAGGFDRYPASQQSLGEELGRRRTQSATANRGDLRQLSKDERAQRKAAAARELEERRKSLVRHPNAPSILHPDYLSPGLNQNFGQISEVPELDSDVYSRPKDLPMRSQSTEPNAKHSSSSTRVRSMFAPRGHQSIGLPATPKAMRLVLEPGAGAGSSTPPSVPPIPAVYGHQRSSGSVGHSSPETKSSTKKQAEATPAPLTLSATTYNLRSEVPLAPKTSVPTKSSEDTLTLLPSTVYQPPSLSRAAIPRSMSAPPQELVFQKGSASQDFTASRKASREKNPTIPESSSDDADLAGTLSPSVYRRPSLDNLLPPPPPPLPAPPMLKELAHLAVPPPPPPAPLPFGSSLNQAPVVYGGHTTGTIEVVTDDGDVQPVVNVSPKIGGSAPSHTNHPSLPPPPPMPPAPPAAPETLSPSRNGHQRGRSSTDNSIAGRISRATERIRSASRGTNNAASRTKSPEITMVPYESIHIPQSQNTGYSPYESVPLPSSFAVRNSPPQQYPQEMQQLTQQQLAQQQLQLQQIEAQNQMRTGLHQSEMI
ncbi:uncharacterized protein SPSK_01401 [Sporothrix schenckii 1099-18]|uniref:Uncharacterized protein n=1 Tax=Sporothrix schenckii 1099-18 TaxID=1397361 RepID=A0A0F2MD94_SPOSC|nr:uncharacterized protein SPSK_01401 [Sporothrix schenckii 1099-18]KJR87039.1 hypothetical protein SPSK_01401 [Sporothrix schenckii 1099-18]